MKMSPIEVVRTATTLPKPSRVLLLVILASEILKMLVATDLFGEAYIDRVLNFYYLMKGSVLGNWINGAILCVTISGGLAYMHLDDNIKFQVHKDWPIYAVNLLFGAWTLFFLAS